MVRRWPIVPVFLGVLSCHAVLPIIPRGKDADSRLELDGRTAIESGPDSAPDSDDFDSYPDGTLVRPFVPGNVPANLLHKGTAPLELTSSVDFDTDTGKISGDDGIVVRPEGQGVISGIHFAAMDDGCRGLGVFSVKSLSVTAAGTLRGVGPRGLVLLVAEAAAISGQVVVSAVGSQPGPGGYPGGLLGEAGQGPGGGAAGMVNTSAWDSGGGGGGHGAEGGDGGDAAETPGGVGGGANGVESLVGLCGGSGGGSEKSPFYPKMPGSMGGGGGGVVQISSAKHVSIQLGGAVRASGGGGSGGSASGGGGGGAGGAILLEAPTIEVLGSLVANGGGGGAGA